MKKVLKNIDFLVKIAAETAMQAAADYLRNNDPKADLDLVIKQMRQLIAAGLDEALADANDAIDANMGHMAEATFLASIRLIGIRAAKTYRDAA